MRDGIKYHIAQYKLIYQTDFRVYQSLLFNLQILYADSTQRADEQTPRWCNNFIKLVCTKHVDLDNMFPLFYVRTQCELYIKHAAHVYPIRESVQ